MKILIVGNYKGKIGSISGQIDLLISCLPKENIEVQLQSTHGNYLKKFISFFQLLFNSRKFDVIHAHGCSYTGFYPIAISIISANLWHKKSVATYHGGEAEKFLANWNWFLKYFFKKLCVLITPSQFLRDVFLNYGYISKIIPNMIYDDIEEFKYRERFNPIFITIRALEKIYNIKLAIDVFSIIKEKFNDAKLIIVGDGSERLYLEDYIKRKRIANILFKGKIDNNNIFHELSNADIMLNPTTVDNYPLSIIEGFLNGILIISSDVGGIPYIVENGRTGYLFKSDDFNSLEKTILVALNDQGKNKEIVNNGLKFANSLKWSNQKFKLLRIYYDE